MARRWSDARRRAAEVAGYCQKSPRQTARRALLGHAETSELWQELNAAGVDRINTDKLEELATFLKGI